MTPLLLVGPAVAPVQALPDVGVLGYHVAPVAALLGLFSGVVFGLLGVGLVLVYRSSRFINFAHGDIGTFGAAVMGMLALRGHVPYWVALPVGMLVSAGLGGLVEIGVVRRLRSAPRLMSMVATIGAGQFLQLLALAVLAQGTAQEYFPNPPGLPSFRMQNVYVSSAYTGMALLGPAAVVALVVFFRRSRFGLAIRGAAANPEAAAMAGMSPARLTTMTWAIAGALACLTAALLLPNSGGQGATSLGPFLLTRALAAAVIGKMDSLQRTFFAGIAIGVVDGIMRYATGSDGPAEVMLFVVILAALLLQARPGRREEEKGTWAAVQPWPPLPEEHRQVWLVRNLGLVLGVVAVGAGALVPLFASNSRTLSFTVLVSFAIVGLSLSVMTGLSGQLSLGQFAVAAVGALAGLYVVHHVARDLVLALVAAAVGGAVTALVIGVPALRVRGLLLAVTSLSFAVAVTSWLLPKQPPIGFGTATPIDDPRVLGTPLRSAHAYWYVALVVLAIALWVTRSVARSGFGRLLVALRDNEDAARAFGVRATLRKLQGYVIGGALAGVGGAVYAFSQSGVSAAGFTPQVSTIVVVITVVGGVGIVAGPLLGAAVALPMVVSLKPGAWAAITFGWLLLVLYAPNGIAGVLRPARDRLVDARARWRGVAVAAARAGVDPARAATAAVPRPRLTHRDAPDPSAAEGEVLLDVRSVVKRYGGLRAVDGVDLQVRRGEVLGLIGPNGAGKTTLFECLSGFVRTDDGAMHFAGRDVTSWSPERRAAAGLIRSFQDSALFSTMTVLETVLVALDRRHPSALSTGLLGVDPHGRRREERARELLALLGLDRYRHVQAAALSTGTRRIAELACCIGLEPTLLLLDEPSSGVAQREVEALGDVLSSIRTQLGTTLLVIEHDIPLVSQLSDRLVAMETGRVLAVGAPAAVLTDPAVVASYLGGDPAAVQRSGSRVPASSPVPHTVPTGA